MTTETLTLTDFLRARLDEDEAVARKIHAERCETPADVVPDSMGRPMTPTCGCDWYVARVLAEVAAKRRIVELAEDITDEMVTRAARHGDEYGTGSYEGQRQAYDDALRALASVHADHPDFREEWRTR